MNLNINYGKIGKSRSLESVIYKEFSKIESLVSDKARAEVWVDNNTNIERKGVPRYSAQVHLVRPRKRDFFIKKTGTDFFKNLQNLTKSLSNLVRKD